MVLLADRDGSVHSRMGAADCFDLLRVYVEAADDYYIRRAVYDLDVAVVIYLNDVSGVEPAVMEAFLRIFLVAEVTGNDGRALYPEHPLLMDVEQPPLAVAYLYLVIRIGASHRAKLLCRLRGVYCNDRRTFCQAIALKDADAEIFTGAPLHLHVEAVSAGNDVSDALQVLILLSESPQQESHYRRHGDDPVYPGLLDSLYRIVDRHKARDHRLAQPKSKRHHSRQVIAKCVEVRQHVEKYRVVIQQAGNVRLYRREIAEHVRMEAGDRLRKSRGPGR